MIDLAEARAENEVLLADIERLRKRHAKHMYTIADAIGLEPEEGLRRWHEKCRELQAFCDLTDFLSHPHPVAFITQDARS